MIINPRLPTGHTIFCDDIREEVGGKYSLIGVYSDLLEVVSFPVVLPQLAFAVTLWESPDDVAEVDLRITYKAEESEEYEVLRHMWPASAHGDCASDEEDDSLQVAEMQVFARLTQVPFNGPGRLKVRAYRSRDEIRLGTLRVQLRGEAATLRADTASKRSKANTEGRS